MKCNWFHPRTVMAGLALSLTLGIGGGSEASAQETSEPALLAQGWTALSQADLEQATVIASRLRQIPSAGRSVATVAYLVEVGVRSGGHLAGLEAYDTWLSGRKLESAYALRPVALTALKSVAASNNPDAIAIAREAFTAEGLTDAVAELDAAQNAATSTDPMAAVRRGESAAVGEVLSQVSSNPEQVRSRTVEALAESRDARVPGALVALLKSPRDDVQAAAAAALGRLGGPEAREPLRELLKAPMFHVKFAAASALFRLGDNAGAEVLQQARGSEHAAVRIGAAEALASRPDAGWLPLVTELVRDKDPEVRARAAGLLAGHDPEAAAAVLQELMADSNPAIRQLAGLTAAGHQITDIKMLRLLLRSTDPRVRARAGSQLLALTR